MGLGGYIINMVNSALQDSTQIPELAKNQSSDFAQQFDLVSDGAIVLWFVILVVGSLAGAWVLDSTPVLLVFFVILALVSLFGLAAFGNMYEAISTADGLSTQFDKLPMTNFIMQYWFIFMLFYMIAMGGVLYMKNNLTGGA
jgi:hypothetical protein